MIDYQSVPLNVVIDSSGDIDAMLRGYELGRTMVDADMDKVASMFVSPSFNAGLLEGWTDAIQGLPHRYDNYRTEVW